MKKYLVGFSWLASVILAHAQSSVTLYGVVDDGFHFNSNAGGRHLYGMCSGCMSGSRWGLKGSEDLGGGVKVIFTIEAGMAINSGALGQGGSMFGRQAFIGVANNLGTLTLGRQYSPGNWYVGWPFVAGASWAASGAGIGAHPGDVDNLDSSNRVNNALVYTMPTVGGFTGGVMYSFGNVPGRMTENRVIAIGGAYVNGPMRLGVGYQVANRPNFSSFGVNPSASPTGNNASSPVDIGYASAGAQKIFAAGAAYTIGSATIAGSYSNTRFTDLGATAVTGLTTTEAAYRGSATFNIGELNFTYQLTPAFSFGVSYSYTRSSGVNDARYQQIDLGVDYFLSKRTDLYGVAVYQRVAGTDSRGLPAVAAITGATASSTNNQTVAVVGIRHKF
ncbi:porin [Burkholderia ubonensis]|uniref:porin n=1 Tax=Burkholderia ubonensis TaxID=101571 RepID=UPI0009B37C6D|nr:porin [Burkholderia ubonensis]